MNGIFNGFHFGGFLSHGPKTIGFNTFVWSSMTWMIWGTPISRNLHVVIDGIINYQHLLNGIFDVFVFDTWYPLVI